MNRDWLATTTEDVIEPELEIVDPHHHLWDTETVYGIYETDGLQLDTGGVEEVPGHNVVQTVFIDCGSNYRADGPEHLQPVGETEYVAGRAAVTEAVPGATIAAIVSHADLTLGRGVTEVLEAHVEAAGGRFRGIRHSAARFDDPALPPGRVVRPFGIYLQSDFQEGARALAAMGLSFEAWQYHTQLDDVVALAQAVPELSIIINHLGGPLGVGSFAGKREHVLADTSAGLSKLAELPNTVLKVGGIGMTRYGVGWEQQATAPSSDEVLALWGDFMRRSIDTFGPDRCMFESNYPVDGETCGYTILWNAFKKISADYSPAERADLFRGTARRAYNL